MPARRVKPGQRFSLILNPKFHEVRGALAINPRSAPHISSKRIDSLGTIAVVKLEEAGPSNTPSLRLSHWPLRLCVKCNSHDLLSRNGAKTIPKAQRSSDRM